MRHLVHKRVLVSGQHAVAVDHVPEQFDHRQLARLGIGIVDQPGELVEILLAAALLLGQGDQLGGLPRVQAEPLRQNLFDEGPLVDGEVVVGVGRFQEQGAGGHLQTAFFLAGGVGRGDVALEEAIQGLEHDS